MKQTKPSILELRSLSLVFGGQLEVQVSSGVKTWLRLAAALVPVILIQPLLANQASLTPAPKVVQLDPAATEYVPVLSGPPETITMRSGSVVLLPSKDVGQHSTGNNEEALVVLAGSGEMRMASGVTLKLKPYVVAYCPPDTEHNVFNTGSEPLRYVYIVAKAR